MGLLPDHRRRLPPEQSAEHRCSGPAKRNQFGGLREGVSLCCVFTVLGPLAMHWLGGESTASLCIRISA